jgi:hypothetical protein
MTANIRHPLNPLQLELLEMYARNVSVQDLQAIKLWLSEFFAQKAIAEADRLWDENGYSQETMEEWLKMKTRRHESGH